MAGNADFINILRDIRGSAAPGQPITNGIWYELTIADKTGNPGIYGDILAKYGIITESAGTFDQAVAILENLNVVVTTLDAGTQATSALVNGVWQLGIPRGTAGIDGLDGLTPEVAVNYSLGKLNYTVTVDGTQITNAVLVDLDQLVDTVVNTNVDVQTTLTAKQEVLDAVETSKAIADGLDANVADKVVQLSNHTVAKIEELNVASAAEQLEISETADAEKLVYDQNAATRIIQYDENHTTKLGAYNANDEVKIEQYNENHVTRLVEFNDAYAGRITDMLRTQNLLGAVDEFTPQVTTQQAKFLSTSINTYLYYKNGIILATPADYTVFNETTIDLVVPIVPGDVVIQVGINLLTDLLIGAGQLTSAQVGVPNGIAGLDENARVPSAQLPSYIDDVLEFSTLATFPATGETGKIYVALDTNKTYRWSGSVYVYITSGAVDSVAGKTGVVTIELGTDTIGNYAVGVTAGAGITVTGTAGEGWSPTIAHADTSSATSIASNNSNGVVIQDVTVTLDTYGHATAASVGTIDLDTRYYTETEVQTALPKIGLDTSNVTAPGTGQIAWNQDERTIDVGVNGVTLQVGQEQLINVRNSSGATILNKTVVMMTGTIGASGRLTVAPFDGSDAKKILGIATEDFANGADGFVTTFGKVRGVNTSAWVNGDVLYATTGGGLTKVIPTSGVVMPIAVVVNSHASAGTLFVRITPVDIKGLTALDRADKYLSLQNVAQMVYSSGNLVKIQYNNPTDVDYEVLSYTLGSLTNIAHYVNSVLKGNTVLTYSSGTLVSAVFTGV